MKEIKGCNALLTGASRGIGVSIATRLADEGVNLALVARTAEDLGRVRKEVVRKGVRAIAVSADLTRLDSLEEIVRTVEQDLGPIDLLINNAAIEDIKTYESLSQKEIEATIALNLTAPMILSRLVIPQMLTRRRGHIVNISSAEGILPVPHSEVYSASKHGLFGFTLCLYLSFRLQKSGLSASVICPGAVSETGMYQRVVETFGKGVEVPSYFGTSKPKEVANAVLRAVQQDRPINVVGRTVIPVLMFQHISPRLTGWVARTIGWHRPLEIIVESKTRMRNQGAG